MSNFKLFINKSSYCKNNLHLLCNTTIKLPTEFSNDFNNYFELLFLRKTKCLKVLLKDIVIPYIKLYVS